jgi:hypothetical protein
MCTTMPFIFDPTVAEAVATWKLVEFCRDLEIQQVIKEGDTLWQEGGCWRRSSQLTKNIKTMLNSFR